MDGPKRSDAKLPYWLTELVAKGALPKESAPGLFARRGKGFAYSGDPAALLALYIRHGMYVEACQLVSLVLGDPCDSELAAKAAFRLPGKGDVDYLPHHKIDLLWGLSNEATRNVRVPAHLVRELRIAMCEMERALEAYFSRLRLSAEGYMSARVLAQVD